MIHKIRQKTHQSQNGILYFNNYNSIVRKYQITRQREDAKLANNNNYKTEKSENGKNRKK